MKDKSVEALGLDGPTVLCTHDPQFNLRSQHVTCACGGVRKLRHRRKAKAR